MSQLTVSCPECDEDINFTRSPLNGEVSICTGCSVELEVISTSPVKVEIAPEVEEDWGE